VNPYTDNHQTSGQHSDNNPLEGLRYYVAPFVLRGSLQASFSVVIFSFLPQLTKMKNKGAGYAETRLGVAAQFP
jgi:hypothetical protein